MGCSNTHFPSLGGSLSPHGQSSQRSELLLYWLPVLTSKTATLSEPQCAVSERPCPVTQSLSGTGRLFQGFSVPQDLCLTFRGEAVDEEGGRGGAVTIEGAKGAIGGG